MSYETQWTLRFGDVDPAGILYYPRLFDRVVRGYEELMIEADWPVSDLIDSGTGMPIVNVEADLFSPARHGQTLDITLSPTVNESSVVFDVSFDHGGETVARAKQTMVTIDLDSFEPRPVPEGLRTALQAV
jgi:4-hydroxybenzoyl-CoA thioesterase